MKALVIDDEPLEGRMIEFVLDRDCPYARYVGQAYTAASGVEMAAQKQPDLIFLDITMDDADGISIIGDLKSACPDIRIVMLTAHDDFDYIRAAMRAGANDYLLKPTRPRDVVEAVERWSGTEAAADDPVEAAKQYVEKNLGRDITLKDMAEKLFLSPAYFSRLFKSRTGITFRDWLAQRRIQRARHYLGETNLSIAEIAQKLGYREANSFSRLFRQSTGQSPSDFRRTARHNEEQLP